MSSVFAALPTVMGRRTECFLLGNERIQKAQKVMIFFRIIVPPNSFSMCIKHSHGQETDGSVTVRHDGFGLLIIKSFR